MAGICVSHHPSSQKQNFLPGASEIRAGLYLLLKVVFTQKRSHRKYYIFHIVQMHVTYITKLVLKQTLHRAREVKEG